MFPADHGDVRGRLIAYDAITGQTKWAVNEKWQVYSGPLTTDAGVMFYGTLDGWFKAADQATGKTLYQFKAPSGIIGNTMTYMHKGKQPGGTLRRGWLGGHRSRGGSDQGNGRAGCCGVDYYARRFHESRRHTHGVFAGLTAPGCGRAGIQCGYSHLSVSLNGFKQLW